MVRPIRVITHVSAPDQLNLVAAVGLELSKGIDNT
jgi:hypothetical protein